MIGICERFSSMEQSVENSLRSKLSLGMESERSLNFATSPDSEGFQMPHKRPKTPRDPMSHRIIEKRRRDRMNNCLADLSHLIPATYLKQGQGRIEKTEIIEMAICHIKHLQILHMQQTKAGDTGAEKFYLGFRECVNEMMRFLVEKQSLSAADPIVVQIMKHLKEQSQHFLPPSGLQKPVEVTKSVGDTLGTISDNKSALSKFDSEIELTIRNMTASEQSRNTPSTNDVMVKEDPISFSSSLNAMRQTEYPSSLSSPFLVDDDAMSNKDSANESMYSDSANGNSDEYYKREIERNREIYKFKSDMKSRFNQGLHSTAEQDRINWREECKTSGEETQNKMTGNLGNRPEMDGVSAKSSPPWESASENNNGNNSNDSGTCLSHSYLSSSTDGAAPSTQTHVPGFALHSTGTYYIPVIINTSSFMAVFQASTSMDRKPGILHPISIPVSFGGHIVPCKPQTYSNASVSTNNLGTSHSNCSSNSSETSEGHSKKKKVPTATLR